MIRIFNNAIPVRAFTLFVSEVALLFFCFIAATLADPDIGDLNVFLLYDSGALRIGIVVAFVVLVLFFRNMYVQVRVRSRLELFQNLCMIFGIAFVGQGMIGYLNRDWIVPRKVMLLGSVLTLVALFTWRLYFDSVARSIATRRKVLFLGMSPTVRQLARYFEEHPEAGIHAVGYLEAGEEHGDAASSDPLPRLGSIDALDDVIDRFEPGSIIIGRRGDIRPWWVEEFLTLRFGGIVVEEASSLYENMLVRKCATEIWPSRLVFSPTIGPRGVGLVLQTAYSFFLAALLLLLTAPLMLIAAILVRLSSPGPVIESELRQGIHENTFHRYRFRCATASGELTPVGKLLRAAGLDRLPRLFNLLRGDMLLVGPRPEHPAYAAELSRVIPFYNQRNLVKPGLTGWARIHCGRQEQNTLRELEYDLYYVENQSPMMDSLILLLTMKLFLLPNDDQTEVLSSGSAGRSD